MNDISRMHEIDATDKLVQNELNHLFSENLLRMNQSFESIFHVFHAQIHLIEGMFVFDSHNVLQSDNISMFEEF